ncbi:MAG: DNA replication/repair protein RecF [Mariprofundaceae bacterium]
MTQAQHTAASLIIRDIRVKNLRCHADIQWNCGSQLNMLTGCNGSGKTTLLEAAYMMAHGRSFRQARDPLLVRRGENQFQINGVWHRYGPMYVNIRGKQGKTEIFLQGKSIQRRKDLTGTLPVLVEAPQGRRLVDGLPNERRHWLDGLMMVCHQGIAIDYQRYLRAVMQRSRILRRGSGWDELDGWEHQIVAHGMIIVQARQILIEELNSHLATEEMLTETPLCLEMQAPDYDKQMWLSRLQGRRQDDARIGGLRFGPHCDRIRMIYQQREIRNAGSRSQQKLAAIALKMAECALRVQHRQLMPALLLDDCLEALDPERQKRLLHRLSTFCGQVLMTAPSGIHIPQDVDIHTHELTDHGLVSETGPIVLATDMEEAA